MHCLRLVSLYIDRRLSLSLKYEEINIKTLILSVVNATLNYLRYSFPKVTLKLVLGLLVFFTIGPDLKAAHLVGGDLSYTCTGNNDYRIRLRIYRDCGSGGAQFDADVDIAVYDINNNLIKEITILKGPTITLSASATGNPCETAPPSSCTEYADYIITDNLPPIAGGYTLTWQRCCRNNSIQNIVDPGSEGNTYTVTIPDNDVACNSSPQFLDPAPVVLCVGTPLNLALNVQENDGDSVHIELCNILKSEGTNGCNNGGITPSPACPPPYNTIDFLAPFTSLSPVPSSPAFAVDPITGIITGTPNQLGRYVVGICASEYRNGVLLSTVRLDYQFVLTACVPNIVSDFLTPIEEPEILCDGLTIDFTSQSVNANQQLWDFGVDTLTTDTSTFRNPIYTYPGPGIYNVTLISYSNNGVCSDTVVATFDLRSPVDPDFSFHGQTCFENQNVLFTPEGNYPADADFLWEFGAANVPVFNGRTPPPVRWIVPGWQKVRLLITSGVCTYIKEDSVLINNLSSIVDAGPDTTIFLGDEVDLTASNGIDWYWYSERYIKMSSRISQTTTVRPLLADTLKFFVRVTDKFGCQGVDSMNVIVIDKQVIAPINFISPDGNDKNEVLDLSDLNPDGECFITIMNRWGSEVYTNEAYNNDWAGTDNSGNQLADGTYYYLLRCDKKIIFKSAITIVRNPD